MIIAGWDPSINHTGWAFVEGEPGTVDGVHLLGSGTVKTPKKMKDEAIHRRNRYWYLMDFSCDAYVDLYMTLEKVNREDRVEAAIIENPTFEESKRGKKLAKTKGLKELYYSAAIIIGATSRQGIPYALPTAKQWKTVPKPAIQARVCQIFPYKVGKWASSDEWEAVGLALWGLANYGKYTLYGADLYNNVGD